MPATAEHVDPDKLAAGTRAEIGTAGVDGGQMSISPDPSRPDGPFALEGDTGSYEPRLVAGSAVCTSGYGDGAYGVYEVVRDGTRVGVEVVFLSPAVDTAAERALDQADTDGTTIRPTDAMLDAVRDRTADDRTRTRVRLWDEAVDAAYAAAEKALMPVTHPSQEGRPVVLGTTSVTGTVGVGDPCYGFPTVSVDLPSGTYCAVAWQADLGEFWGTRVVRLGLYAAA